MFSWKFRFGFVSSINLCVGRFCSVALVTGHIMSWCPQRRFGLKKINTKYLTFKIFSKLEKRGHVKFASWDYFFHKVSEFFNVISECIRHSKTKRCKRKFIWRDLNSKECSNLAWLKKNSGLIYYFSSAISMKTHLRLVRLR